VVASDQPPTEPIPAPPLDAPPGDPIDIAIPCASTRPVPTSPVMLTVTIAMKSIRFMIVTSPAELACAPV
jgi:hypothetical protein